MIKTVKILNNIYDIRVTNFLSKSNFSTIGYNFKLFVQHANFSIRKWFFSICIVDIWNHLPTSVVNAPNVMCFEKRLSLSFFCCADIKIKVDHEAPLNYSEFSYTKIKKSQNIDFDGELSVEANAIWAQYKTCEYTCEYNRSIHTACLQKNISKRIYQIVFVVVLNVIRRQLWRKQTWKIYCLQSSVNYSKKAIKNHHGEVPVVVQKKKSTLTIQTAVPHDTVVIP